MTKEKAIEDVVEKMCHIIICEAEKFGIEAFRDKIFKYKVNFKSQQDLNLYNLLRDKSQRKWEFLGVIQIIP